MSRSDKKSAGSNFRASSCRPNLSRPVRFRSFLSQLFIREVFSTLNLCSQKTLRHVEPSLKKMPCITFSCIHDSPIPVLYLNFWETLDQAIIMSGSILPLGTQKEKDKHMNGKFEALKVCPCMGPREEPRPGLAMPQM